SNSLEPVGIPFLRSEFIRDDAVSGFLGAVCFDDAVMISADHLADIIDDLAVSLFDPFYSILDRAGLFADPEPARTSVARCDSVVLRIGIDQILRFTVQVMQEARRLLENYFIRFDRLLLEGSRRRPLDPRRSIDHESDDYEAGNEKFHFMLPRS